MGTNREQDHRDRIATSEWWSEEEAEAAWQEARSSARMLGCLLMGTSALIMGIVLAVVVPPLVSAVQRWLGGG